MEKKNLETFYEAWSKKSHEALNYDIEAAIRKADAIVDHIPADLLKNIHSILDFGCGYGALLHRLTNRLKGTLTSTLGVDFSSLSIEVAQKQFEHENLEFHKLPQLDIAENIQFLSSISQAKFDCILLIDLLEHIPDSKALVSSLAPFTRFFILKLPVESSLVDNYLLPKEYPSSIHSNGHLREFDANNVHYYVRQLGLTPLSETLYIYHPDDAFPPLPAGLSIRHRIVRWIIRKSKVVASRLLPKKIFLRCVGGGGYICLATFDKDHLLTP
jgi:SAM-dependent methyltransferase